MLFSTQSKCSMLSGLNLNGSFIFPKCKYTKWYCNIIEKRLNEEPIGYCERHHIIPKFMGGSNEKNNLVKVTGREHYILHLLLMKICKKSDDRKIYGKSVYSVLCFTMSYYHKDRHIVPSRVVELLRIEMSKLRKGVSPPNKGLNLTQKCKQKMKDNHWLTNGGTHPMLGNSHREESVEKMRVNSTKQWWDVYSPSGEYFNKVSVNEMIRKHNLNIDCIRRFKGKVIPEISERVRSQTKQSRLNSTGWLFILL